MFEKINTAEDFLKAVDDSRNNDEEGLFEDLINIATPLSLFLKKLIASGFTRREAMRLVEAHQNFIYSMTTEEFLAQKRSEQLEHLNDMADEEDADDDDDDILR